MEEKELEKEEVEIKKEEKVETKEKKPKINVFKTIFNIVFWVVVIGLAATWIIDYLHVRNNQEPSFCLSNKTHKFDDGNVEECVGLGYKVYTYNRSSLATGTEFVPFFVNMKK